MSTPDASSSGDSAGLAEALGAFVDDVGLMGARQVLARLEEAAAPPAFVGPYRLERVLGEGGMGVVYLAQQEEPVRRRVAVKLIRPGLASGTFLLRFGAERQALARMEHPGIARILDAGATGDGRPWFAMEFVDGAAITAYADARGLSVRARLELFLGVCDAVQHAHQKGVLHRDLKPGNLLVQEQDGAAVVKVIDFGLAKEREEPSTEQSPVTVADATVGTLYYMSPEQASGGARAVDTRTDLYSLGVVLYELVAGAHPLDDLYCSEAPPDEVRRSIREVEPPRPSARLATAPERLAAAAKLRGTTPRGLARALRADVDWIALKCLAKDPARRYAGVSELGADLGRHLAGQPVLAGPPTLAYRMSRFVKRHRAGVAAAVVAVLAAVGSGAIGLKLFLHASAAEAAAASSAAIAEHMQAYLESLLTFGMRNASEHRETSLTDLARHAARELDEQLSAEPAVEATIRRFLGMVLHQAGDIGAAEEQLRRSLAVLERRPALPAAVRAPVLGALAAVVADRGDAGSAAALARSAYDSRLHESPVDQRALLAAALQLARLETRAGNGAAAVLLLEPALEEHRKVFGADGAEVLMALNELALALAATGRGDDAETLFVQAIGGAVAERASVRRIAVLRRDHGRFLARQQRFAEAEAELLASHELLVRNFTATHRLAFETIQALAELYEAWGRAADAALWRSRLPDPADASGAAR